MGETTECFCGAGSRIEATREDRAASILDIAQLKGALAGDDLHGLIDLVLRRLLELTDSDYIALHSVDGHHLMLHPDGKL